jgi:hypothetical protein
MAATLMALGHSTLVVATAFLGLLGHQGRMRRTFVQTFTRHANLETTPRRGGLCFDNCHD